MRLIYTGPHEAVDVVLPNGFAIRVSRGGDADFAAEVGASLLEQTGHWRRKKSAPASAPARTDSPAALPAETPNTPDTPDEG